MSTAFESPFETDDSAGRMTLGSADMATRGCVVNRTHRVVRERARVMQERRSRERVLMVPLVFCSGLLLLLVFAMWSGLYQNPAVAEAFQTDVAALAALDASNHYMVALLWFVPACLAVLATVLCGRMRASVGDKGGR